MLDSRLPPDYDASNSLNSNDRDVDLPAYSSSSGIGHVISPLNFTQLPDGTPLKEFTYNIFLKGNKSCASLVLYANTFLSKQLPTFLEGSRVDGSVKVNVENGESINAVTISIQGKVLSGARQHIFLDHSQTLWPLSSTHSDGLKLESKLQGEYSWPFSIHLPKEVTLTVGSRDAPRVEVFRLPHTFMERHARASVQYEVIVRFARGLLKTDHRIIASFSYIPITRPEPPSQLRQVAYEENKNIPGPIADPQGWYTLPPAQIQGKLFNRQSVDLFCTLSLALPLSYTRGSVIPLHLVIQTNDIQALETLSSPRAIICRLRRTLRYNKTVDPKLRKDEFEHSELATWWPCVESPPPEKETFKRSLNGEIALSPDLKPTISIARFQIEYTVVLFPFDANSFRFESNDLLLDCAVEIATTFAPGPRPRMNRPEYQAV
ncbi:hypothetical protein J3R30DRAFT_3291468 [Lentinula aciculospora]|uniref:Arrestin-like N-terminal domain-containing protein n=1 Tax=Lentinula aciculospora TaxID=153920 RepID=A0A9W9DM69_9AGAR|nr:hypothetical protein J3R30DRAFT_3291468 [Lentinula aciculospora]